MKKLFALMMVSAFAVAIVACGGKKEESATDVDTTVVVAPAPDTTVVDTTAVDTTAAQ
ncbi:unnamed protein product [Phaeothamnion confervicola]